MQEDETAVNPWACIGLDSLATWMKGKLDRNTKFEKINGVERIIFGCVSTEFWVISLMGEDEEVMKGRENVSGDAL